MISYRSKTSRLKIIGLLKYNKKVFPITYCLNFCSTWLPIWPIYKINKTVSAIYTEYKYYSDKLRNSSGPGAHTHAFITYFKVQFSLVDDIILFSKIIGFNCWILALFILSTTLSANLRSCSVSFGSFAFNQRSSINFWAAIELRQIERALWEPLNWALLTKAPRKTISMCSSFQFDALSDQTDWLVMVSGIGNIGQHLS